MEERMRRVRFLAVGLLAVGALIGPAAVGVSAAKVGNGNPTYHYGWLCGPYGDNTEVVGSNTPQITTRQSVAAIFQGDKRSDYIACHFNQQTPPPTVTTGQPVDEGYCSFNQFTFRNRTFVHNDDNTWDLYCSDARPERS
jgi:hypothetical protein